MQAQVLMSQNSNATQNPLVRQNASFGSVDFLKLLDPGPNGEPLTFAEVLAANPDWAEQNADPSLVQANLMAAAQPMDSTRNPGGGAEPLAGSSALLEEAIRLTGSEVDTSGQDALKGLPSIGTNLPANRFSGNLSQLVRHPSFSSQLQKDPSFGTAVFQSLLSQKSEDQAMLWAMLGIDPATGQPIPGSHAVGAEPANLNGSRPVSLDTGQANSFAGSDSQVNRGRLPVQPQQLRDQHLGDRWHGSFESLQRNAMPAYNLGPFRPSVQAPLADEQLRMSPLGNCEPSLGGSGMPWPGSAQPPGALGNSVLPPLGRDGISQLDPGQRRETAQRRDEAGKRMGEDSAARDSVFEGKPIDLGTSRASSLNYLLQGNPLPSRQIKPPSQPGLPPVAPRAPLASPESARFAAPMTDLTFNTAPGLPPEPAGFKPVVRRSGEAAPGKLNHPKPITPRASYPSRPPFLGPQSLKIEEPALNRFQGQLAPLGRPGAGLAALPPLNLGSALNPASLRGDGWTPLTNGTASDLPKEPLAAKPADSSASEKGKTKFMTGLISGISPLVAKQENAASPPKEPSMTSAIGSSIRVQTAGSLSPKEGKTYATPSLPSMPKVPSLQEYQRSLTATALSPKLGILPLQGLPGQAPWPSPPTTLADVALPKGLSGGAFMASPAPSMAPTLAPLDIAGPAARPQPGSSAVFRPLMPELPTAPTGSLDMPPLANLNVSGRRNTGSGSLAYSDRGQRKRSRVDDIHSNPDVSTSQGDVLMDSDVEAEGKRELRKAKNRASAAASRARREAYTAALEIQVQKLRDQQAWLVRTLETKSQGLDTSSEPRRMLKRRNSF